VALVEGTRRLGTSPDAEILSDDPDVAARHAAVVVRGSQVGVEGLGEAAVFVDGLRVSGMVSLAPGQQLRIGRSLWRISRRITRAWRDSFVTPVSASAFARSSGPGRGGNA
jgi:pSer/pThr/pTyr-binding forkhead associated (FHA) protein